MRDKMATMSPRAMETNAHKVCWSKKETIFISFGEAAQYFFAFDSHRTSCKKDDKGTHKSIHQ